MPSEIPAIKVYYDGLCRLCSREMAHYQKQTGSHQILFIDICAPGFDSASEGVDPVQVHKVMHVKRADGSLATRVGAFIEIWQILPRYRWMAKVARLSLVRGGMEIGYSVFAYLRPWLPRKNAALECAESPYCESNK